MSALKIKGTQESNVIKYSKQRFCRKVFCEFSITNTDVKFRLYVIRNEALRRSALNRCGRLSVFWIFRRIEIFIKLVRENAAHGNEIGEKGTNNNITVLVTLKSSYNSIAVSWLLLRNYQRCALSSPTFIQRSCSFFN